MWLFIVIIGLISFNCGHGSRMDRDLPCHFLDSINITDGALQTDNSIIFDGTKFIENQYSRIDYILDNGTHHKSVEPHLRGCLCSIKPCIRLCCPYGTIQTKEKRCSRHEAATEFESEIYAENSNARTLLENHHFGYVDGRPCNSFYVVNQYTMNHVMKFPKLSFWKMKSSEFNLA